MSKFIERVLEYDPNLRQSPNPYTLSQDSEVFNRVLKGQEIIERVIAWLIVKATRTRMEQGVNNKSTFGNVQFWFNNVKDKRGNVLKSELGFSHTCDQWSLEAILVDIEEAERNMLLQDGVIADVKVINQ